MNIILSKRPQIRTLPFCCPRNQYILIECMSWCQSVKNLTNEIICEGICWIEHKESFLQLTAGIWHLACQTVQFAQFAQIIGSSKFVNQFDQIWQKSARWHLVSNSSKLNLLSAGPRGLAQTKHNSRHVKYYLIPIISERQKHSRQLLSLAVLHFINKTQWWTGCHSSGAVTHCTMN